MNATRTLALFAALGFASISGGCKREQASPSPTSSANVSGAVTSNTADNPGDEATADDEEPRKRPPPTTISLSTADRTTADEKPVDIADQLDALAASAAKKAGFTVSEDGNRAEVEVYYAFTVDGVPTPKADRGILVYAVTARVRVVDAQGVGELIEGRAGSDAPFVRAALPDLKVAFRTLLEEATESALTDVALQMRYRALPVDQARAGLSSPVTEERWAAARRLGELGDAPSAPALIAMLEDSGPVEVGVLAGVLGQLKVARAVDPLVAHVEAVPSEIGVIIVDALAAIGTSEATAALTKIAKDHPLDGVRAAAKERLAPPSP